MVSECRICGFVEAISLASFSRNILFQLPKTVISFKRNVLIYLLISEEVKN